MAAHGRMFDVWQHGCWAIEIATSYFLLVGRAKLGRHIAACPLAHNLMSHLATGRYAAIIRFPLGGLWVASLEL